MNTSTAIRSITSEHLGVDEANLKDTDSFIDDLGADSLDSVELVMAFEEEFGVEIPDSVAETITTLGDAIETIDKMRKSTTF